MVGKLGTHPMAFLDFLNPLSHITNGLTKAYETKLNAANHGERIKAEVEIAGLEAKRDAMIAASIHDKWWSPRNLMGWSVAIFVFKIVVVDSTLGWDVTPNVGSLVTWIVVTVIGFYFVSKSAEKITDTLAAAIARRGAK